MPSRLTLLALTVVAVLAAVQLAPSPSRAAFEDADGDGAIDLAEEVFGSDPADAGSTPENLDFLLFSGSVACQDGLDNDVDGLTDVSDSGCVNSDGESLGSDHTETFLGAGPEDDESFPEDRRLDALLVTFGYPFLTCADGEDDDGDGLTDEADPGCAPLDADDDGFDDFVEKTVGADWWAGYLNSPGGRLHVNVNTFTLPSCPASSFSIDDPVGDADPEDHVDTPMDIASISTGFDDANVCVTVGLSRPADPTLLRTELEIDTDSRRETGKIGYISLRCNPTGLGVDLRVVVGRGDEGLLARLYPEPSAPVAVDPEPVYFVFGSSSYTFIVPRGRLGEDGGDLRSAIEAGNWQGRRGFWPTDCVPNGGHIRCEDGVCAFVPFRNGDANCGGGADSIDAAIVLQFGAGLLDELACPDAADVNGDGLVDSRDAALILQFGAGLLGRLPPPEVRF